MGQANCFLGGRVPSSADTVIMLAILLEVDKNERPVDNCLTFWGLHCA